ncbi:MAG: hypothetical protein IPP40_13585 [bacterium]|nr:hypothetical protein [bacterium]
MLRSTGVYRAGRICVLAIMLVVPFLVFSTGCSVTPAEGKLQVMYSGNLRGAVSPCGCKISKGGMARLATFFQRNQDPTANWLTVDAGNFVDKDGAKSGCSVKCKFLLTSYDELDYDVLNIARQEIAMGYETLTTLRDTSKSVEFVSANLMDVKKNRLMFEPYAIKDYGNMKVGVMGLIRDADFPPTASVIDTNTMRVSSTREAADRYLPKLKNEVNSIVVLCELSSDDIDTLVKAHPYIDLVISSGALKSGETTISIGNTRVVGVGSSGYNGHWAKLEYNPAWGDSFAYADYKDALIDTYELPGEWTDKLAAFEDANGFDRKTKNTTAAQKAALDAPAGVITAPTNQMPTGATLTPTNHSQSGTGATPLNHIPSSTTSIEKKG